MKVPDILLRAGIAVVGFRLSPAAFHKQLEPGLRLPANVQLLAKQEDIIVIVHPTAEEVLAGDHSGIILQLIAETELAADVPGIKRRFCRRSASLSNPALRGFLSAAGAAVVPARSPVAAVWPSRRSPAKARGSVLRGRGLAFIWGVPPVVSGAARRRQAIYSVNDIQLKVYSFESFLC